ncbi:hypothetical protein CCAX7_32880 [Capsulimonas corticalis]|uniref:Uncharacterized protein n=1 Tax=Capsulimonas corticalis TaxID=2219043 RepID=A0A402CYV4_9BACT|nr:DUF3084 domain-containing protein [Capsulimonas corticalis]BDI31237.1 hypothetical protein CCAX7_32880 [Capsulimonas corticalis]
MAALILTALILFVAGGCIALLGDRLGTYVGKKRISKFGLRPRETAKLYTFFSGSIIALLVLLLLLVLNSSYLHAISERSTLKKNIGALRHENTTLEAQIRKVQIQIAAATAQVTQANEDLRQAVLKKSEAEHALRAAQQSLTEMKGKLSGTQTRLAVSQKAVAARQHELQVAQSHLETMNSRLRVSMANLNATVDDLSHVRLESKQEIAAANSRIKELKSAGNILNLRNQALRADNSDLTTANRDMAAANEALRTNSVTLASQPLIYRGGGELGRTTIDAAQSPENIRAALSTWLEQLDRRAYDAGAAAGPQGSAIILVNPPSQNLQTNAGASTKEAIIDAVVSSISDQRLIQPSVAVIAEAKYNTAAGEQVRVDLRPYNNVLVFRAGQVITSSTIDGTKDETAIKQSLFTFLANSVRRRAIDSGVIAEHDPVTGNVTATIWDIAKVGDTIKEIQAAGADAHVDAIALSDTYSIEPVPLRLVVTSNAPLLGPGFSKAGLP